MSARNEPCVFVVGAPRSGTKLLRALLDRHPLIGMLPCETEFLFDWEAGWHRQGDLASPERFARFAARQNRRLAYFRYRAVESERPPVDAAAWHAACAGDFSAAGIFAGLARVETAEGCIWGDKSPSYLRHIVRLARRFPLALIVMIRRDVRDGALSASTAWRKSPLRYAARWQRDLLEARTAGEVLGRRFIEVGFEDLVTDTEATMRAICARLAVPFEPRMLAPGRAVENLGSARGLTDVATETVGRFRHRLERATWRRIEEIAWPAMIACGYGPELACGPRPLQPAHERLLQIADGFGLWRAEAGFTGPAAAAGAVARRFAVSGNRH